MVKWHLSLALFLLFPPLDAGARIRFDSSVAALHRETIREDIRLISKILQRAPVAPREYREIFKTREASPRQITSWLYRRVRFITESIEGRIYTLWPLFSRGQYLPKELEAAFDLAPGAKARNLGMHLYDYDKNYGQDLAYIFNDADYDPPRRRLIPIITPRVGLLLLGEDFFSGSLTSPFRHRVNGILRVHLLLHEARHSDGQGEQQGYPHDRCPAGHDYEFIYQCDSSSKGPHTVSANFLRYAIRHCHKCDEVDQTILRAVLASVEGHILTAEKR